MCRTYSFECTYHINYTSKVLFPLLPLTLAQTQPPSPLSVIHTQKTVAKKHAKEAGEKQKIKILAEARFDRASSGL